MAVYTFRGIVLPVDIPLSLDYRPELVRTEADESPDTRIIISIEDGAISATVEVDGEGGSYASLHGIVSDLVRKMTDLATVRDGVAYIPYIEEVDLPSGETERLALADRRLAALCPQFTDESFEELTDMAIGDNQLACLIGDVAIMLSWQNYVPIAAGRVTDGVLRLVTGGRTAEHWRVLQSTLHVDRSFLQPMSDESKPARHGHRVYVSSARNRMLAERAWILLDRYVAYRRNGCGVLDPVEYPILYGEA